MSKRKPHNQDAGYVAERRTVYGHVVIYAASEQHIDVGGAKYAVVCTGHGAIVAETTLRGARLSMKTPTNFCDGCREDESPHDR